MEVAISDAEPIQPHTTVILDDLKLREVVSSGSLEFDDWTSLISEIEENFPEELEKIGLVYDGFLSLFPLCYGYWKKYADHVMRLSSVDKVVEIFERAVESATYSVDVWVDYCRFACLVFEDSADVRSLFTRALSFVGKDYLCYKLWDAYIEFEFSHQNWSSLAHIYIQVLRFPTKKLYFNYASFKKLVGIWDEEMKSRCNCTLETSDELKIDGLVPSSYKLGEISCIITELLDRTNGLVRFKALQRYKSIGEWLHQESSQLNGKINLFETHIRRSYFHPKPLDYSQLENWHHYLDFAESHGDFDWAVKLYERCLIPCASYTEFWIRYAEFMDSKGGREIANFALDRATITFVKTVPTIHLFNAKFKESIRDISSAHAAFLRCDAELDSDFIEVVIRKANLEKRLGNLTTACNTYKNALDVATARGKMHLLPTLYINFSQLKYMTTKDEDAARDILIDGIKAVPSSRLLIEELIKFSMTHGGSRHINAVESVVYDAISPGQGALRALSVEDAEEISRLYLQFVDLCGMVHDTKTAWNKHIRLFPDSLRKIFYRGTNTKRWKMAAEAKQETLVPSVHQGAIDGISDRLIQSSLQDEKPSSPENHNAKATLLDVNPVPDQKSLELENQIMPSELPGRLQSDECAKHLHEIESQTSSKISELPGSDGSTEFPKQSDVEQQHDNEPGENTKHLHSQDSKYSGQPIPTSYDSKASGKRKSYPDTSHSQEVESSQENVLTGESLLEGSQPATVDPAPPSPLSSRVAVSSVHVNFDRASPSSANNQNILGQAHPQPYMAANSGRNRYQNSDRNRRDSRFSFRRNSHQRFNRHASPPQQPRRTEMRSQMPMNQGYPPQTLSSWAPQLQQGSQVQSHYPASDANSDATQSQAYSMQHAQQHNILPEYQGPRPVQPVVYSQTQMPQNPMQNDAQHGNVQNNEAYNQMWQYYYYQQQQQQSFLWQQPPHQQLQYLQQQLLQIQHLQQQQQSQPEQQQQLIMQQQLIQQQMYQLQQHMLYLQQQQSVQLQQPQHQQQQSVQLQQPQHQQQQSVQLQQPQHQQQPIEQQHQHQQTLQPKQQEHEQGEGKSEQQIGVSQNQETRMESAVEDNEL